MATLENAHRRYRIEARAARHRANDVHFEHWASGYGVINHDDLTQVRVYDMVDALIERRQVSSKKEAYQVLAAADRISNAAMWLVVHMTYARNVHSDGRSLSEGDFKRAPEGHTGGSLNMVPAYVGYLAANALSGVTRSWLMGQGHCVAAIDATNLIVDNLMPALKERYPLTDVGLSQFVQDFYAYQVGPDGRPVSPLGSHVNANTAGGMIEGGYLGFAELLYGHMPLPGEQLVAFLSDGAFEEQRGSDWIPRWWRAEDTGLIAPIMIANGRRIDQRSTMAQIGGVDWFREHLRLNGFDPIDLDGRDPAAFAWAIHEIEERLKACGDAARQGNADYPVPLHYGIAEAPKGFGFPGAGTNRAHNLPLEANPSTDKQSAEAFNAGASALFVPSSDLFEAIATLNNHRRQGRPKERDHPICARPRIEADLPDPEWQKPEAGRRVSPMAGIDAYFTGIARTNPQIRARVGNPDEMRSNQMGSTLDFLKHRVTAPEPGVAEAVNGGVITALNEEAVICAVLANKGGINLAVSYEAFAVKMLGAVRQDLIFTRNLLEAGRPVPWLGTALVLTSHVWENGKNELSHQDPTMAEALFAEMSDLSRVVFPADWNSAVACLKHTYLSRGEIWTIVAPKRDVPVRLTREQATKAVAEGAVRLRGDSTSKEKLLIAAVGAYQLDQALLASDRLADRGIPHGVTYILEPGRFRLPRDRREAAFVTATESVAQLFSDSAQARVFITHTRPEPIAGLLRPLDSGSRCSRFLGFRNRGGTLDTNGMLFANRCTWGHILANVAEVLPVAIEDLLTPDERDAVEGRCSPIGILF